MSDHELPRAVEIRESVPYSEDCIGAATGAPYPLPIAGNRRRRHDISHFISIKSVARSAVVFATLGVIS